MLSMKLEAVVLAAGSGSRMVELTKGQPKCLLPVGNQSLLWFAVTGLRLAGIGRIIALVPDAYELEIKQYCHKKFNSYKELDIEFVTVSSKSDCGSAESILAIRDKIRGDFIVHSCDSVVDPRALIHLINHYRLHDAMLSMLLSDNAAYFQPRSMPGRREKESYTRDLIAVQPLDELNVLGVDGSFAAKLVFLHSENDLKQKLKIRNAQLALHPSLEVFTKYLDSHIYLFKNQMLDFMSLHPDKAVLKNEVIPFLIAKQFSKDALGADEHQMEDDEELELRNKIDYEEELKGKLESFRPQRSAKYEYFQPTKLPMPSECHAVIVKDLFAHRCNTLGSYLDCNKEAKIILNSFMLKNFTTIKDSVVGENTTVDEKCTLKKNSIGSNCKIGAKCKLFDCIIMDNVEIESNTSLSECIVGADTQIGSKCDLKSCVIGHRQTIPSGRKANFEWMTEFEDWLDE